MRLRRSDPSGPGVRRLKAGTGFRYVDQNGAPVDPATLERAKALVLPPAWTDVWICPWPHGHIQATGVDAAGRRQYRYHDEWRRLRDREKHEHVLEVAALLPGARRRATAALRRPDLDRERVVAGCFRILDRAALRVGGEAYAEEHDSYGLATLRRDHASVTGDRVAFCFVGKSGQGHELELRDRTLARLVADLLARDDDHPDLLAWHDDAGWHDVRSVDVNAGVRQLIGADVTAKDFRTWNATVLMAQRLAVHGWDASVTRRRRTVVAAYKEVAAYLGNTPTVARTSYVDPRVVDLFHDGDVVPARAMPRRDLDLPVHESVERAVARMLLPDKGSRRRTTAAAA